MNDIASASGLLGAAVVLVAATVAWWSARPVLVSSILRRSGEARARVVGRGTLGALERLDTLVVDPIGSVTHGELRVVGVEPIDPEHDRSLRWFAGALQHGTDDPVARAVARLSVRGGATDVERLPGIGVIGRVDRHPVRVGTPEWIGLDAEQYGPTEQDDWTETLAVEVDGRAMGRITVADSVREQAAAALSRMADDGCRVVLVVPHAAAARHLAASVPASTTVDVDAHPAATVEKLLDQGRHVGRIARAGSTLVATSPHGLVVTDGSVGHDERVELADVAIHHVAATLPMLRGAQRRLRLMRRSVLTVTAAGIVALALVPTGPPDVAATAATVLALPVALAAPLARWG
jgi:cation transport ATPase